MNTRVLVTGGAGFIGSELVGQLVSSQCEVRVVDNLVNGRRENLQHIDASRMRLITADIRNAEAMRGALKDVDVVFHLACLGLRHSIHSPVENHDVNATATLGLLMLARSAGVGRFVYVSSSEVYGTARTVPMAETHPTSPTTVYGASKLAAECYTRAFYSTYGFPAVVIRPFNAFGPRSHHEGESGEVIPKFLLRALAGRPMIIFGDGTQTRDFTFVSDIAAAITTVGLAEGFVGETLNIGSGRSVSIAELAHMVGCVVGQPIEVVHEEPRPGDVHDLSADVTKASTLIGFAPTVTVEDGLQRLRDWYMAQSASPAELLETDVVRNWMPPPWRPSR